LLSTQRWSISAIVFWEIAKLAQLKRIHLDMDSADFAHDPADELIAATSIVHGAPPVTRDGKLRESLMVPLA